MRKPKTTYALKHDQHLDAAWLDLAANSCQVARDNRGLGNLDTVLKDIRRARRWLTLAEQSIRLEVGQ